MNTSSSKSDYYMPGNIAFNLLRALRTMVVFFQLSLLSSLCIAQDKEERSELSDAQQVVVDFYQYLASGDIPLEFLPRNCDIITELRKNYSPEVDPRQILRDFLVKNKNLFLHPDIEFSNGILRVMFVSPAIKMNRLRLSETGGVTENTGVALGEYITVVFFGKEGRSALVPIMPVSSQDPRGARIRYDGIYIGMSKILLAYTVKEAGETEP